MSSVLVVDDEPQILRALQTSLRGAGYDVETAATGEQALTMVAVRPPDAVILDLVLPDMAGTAVCRELRKWTTVPIIVLSAVGDESEKVAALDAGADDYVTKPFGVDELLARIRVALRHSARSDSTKGETSFRHKGLEVDLEKRLVSVSGKEVHLTPIEYRLLATLVKHAGKVLTHKQLLIEVWGPNAEFENQYVRVYMNQLRHKLESEPARPKYLVTETGVGYRLKTS